jgi:hypothetical protein
MSLEALVDSNVILDIVTEDKRWASWSARAIEEWSGILVINPIIYAEVSIGFERIEDLDEALSMKLFRRDLLPWDAAFLAGKCFLKYRQSGGKKTSPLPDFFIGAHAAVTGMALITRDASRYRTYFPRIRLVSPT